MKSCCEKWRAFFEKNFNKKDGVKIKGCPSCLKKFNPKIVLKIMLVGLSLFMTVNCNAEPISFKFNSNELRGEDRSFLEMFNLEEQCIVLAFEPQLDVFRAFYSSRHIKKFMFDTVDTTPSITLRDVASLYLDQKDKTLDGFLDYIVAEQPKSFIGDDEEGYVLDVNIEAFRKKVWQDYRFIKKQKEDESTKFALVATVLKIYKEVQKTSWGKKYLKQLGVKPLEGL